MIKEEWWNRSKFLGELPPLLCGYCSDGDLVYDADKKLSQMSPAAEENYKSDHGDVMELWGSFTTLAQCSRCSEYTTVCAEYYFDEIYLHNDYEDMPERTYETAYYIDYVSPAPALVTIPTQLSPQIINTLKKSFILFWVDTDSCANKIRQGLELFFNIHKIPRTTVNNKGKRVDLTLHSRIDKFGKKHPDLKDYLIALKHICNQGSHSKDEITREHILVAYEMLGLVFKHLYDDTAKRLRRKALEINRKRKI